MASETDEEVMVVETSRLQTYLDGRPSALIRDSADAILQVVAERHFFVPRKAAEVEPKWRQIIPYVAILHHADIYTLRRTRKQAEARLHDKVSIGIGGHVNPGHDVLSGLYKELEEEVDVPGAYDLEPAGILNDQSTDVGRVHLGVAFLLRAYTDAVRVRETDKMVGEWCSAEELANRHEQMESWSQILFDALLRP